MLFVFPCSQFNNRVTGNNLDRQEPPADHQGWFSETHPTSADRKWRSHFLWNCPFPATPTKCYTMAEGKDLCPIGVRGCIFRMNKGDFLMEAKRPGSETRWIRILTGFGALVALSGIVQGQTATLPKQSTVVATSPATATESPLVAPRLILAQNEPTRVEAPSPPDEASPESRLVSPSDHVAEGEIIAPAESTCIPVPVCEHKLHRSARRFLACNCGTTHAVLEVTNPADCLGCCPADCLGCCYEIQLCLPECCTGTPCQSSRVGLFRRGMVEYCWPCGWRATVVFRARGDVVVHYNAN